MDVSEYLNMQTLKNSTRQQEIHSGGLDGKLSSTPIHARSKQAIINHMFNRRLIDVEGCSTSEKPEALAGIDAYFNDWYEEQCEVATGHVSVITHQDVLDVIKQLRSTNLTRSEIFHNLLQKAPLTDPNLLNASINLAARLWLMLSIGSVQQSLVPGNSFAWDHGKLSDALQGTLWPSPQLDEKIKLPKTFTAVNLERIAGLKVVWTSNLADHLCLKDDDTKVMLYHQATFLELHKDSNSSIFPKDLVEETTRTLGLLIPSIDKKSKTWFQQKQKELNLDPKAGTYGPLNASSRQIEHFNYWRDRLIILKQTFDDVEPHSLSLLVFDDRKKVQWYTFWIAALVLLLTIVFGLVQSVAGVVQAWAAVRSMPPVKTI